MAMITITGMNMVTITIMATIITDLKLCLAGRR